MTKSVRIENADTAQGQVIVWVENEVGSNWIRDPIPIKLAYPTQLVNVHIHKTQRLVIEEVL